MGLFKKEKDESLAPDLTAYRKAILLHNVTLIQLDTLIKEYGTLWKDKKEIACDFRYTALPDDPAWIYLEFPNFDGVPHGLNFWNYQNLMIWITQKSDKEFCLAIPFNQSEPLFLSTLDQNNPYGDSCVGIYADRDFYFNVPENLFEWGPVPDAPFDYTGFLSRAYQFDTQWIPKIAQSQWKKTQIILTVGL